MPGHRGLTPAEVQGAQSGFNSVAQVLQSLAEQKQRQQQLEIEQQRADEEAANRKDISQRAWKQLQLDTEARADLHNSTLSQRALLAQQVLHNYELGAPLPAGSTMSEQPPGAFGDYRQISNPALGISNETVMSPQEYATQRAQIERIAGAPAEESKIRETQALQDSEFAKQIKLAAQQHQDRLDEEAARNTYETNRQQDMIEAQRALRDSENSMSIRRAMIEATGGLSEFGKIIPGTTIATGADGQPSVNQQGVGDFVSNTIRQLRDGQMSSDQLKKQFPKQASAILGIASQQGIGALTEDSRTKLNDLNTIAQVVPILKEMNEINMSAPNSVLMNPMSKEYKQFQTDKQIVMGSIPAVSRVLGGVKRFNGFEMKDYENYLLPTRGLSIGPLDLTKPNIDKYNSFVTHDIQDAFNTATSSIPDGQRAIIKQRIGLNNLPSLGSALQTPGAPTGTPSGMTPAIPAQGTPNQIHWVMQNGKLVQVGQQPQQ
jgi:hypothetical protein